MVTKDKKELAVSPASPESTESIVQAASVLQVSEYKVFELAYKMWFAREPDDEQIASKFGAYVDGGPAPYWVRDFSRKVVSACDGDSCDLEFFGVERPEVDPDMRDMGQWYVIMLIIMMSAFLYMAVNTPPIID